MSDGAAEKDLSRRALLTKLGGAAALGAGIAAAKELAAPSPAAAATADYDDTTATWVFRATQHGSGNAVQAHSDGIGSAMWVSVYSGGTGTAIHAQIDNTANGNNTILATTAGVGAAVHAEINNAANTIPTVYGSTTGTGAGVQGRNYGGGHGVFGEINATNNGSAAVRATTNGTGRGVDASITATTNTATAVFGSTAGLGNAVEGRITRSTNTASAVYGATTGVGRGVHGEIQSGGAGVGVLGSTNGNGIGVRGISANGIGVVAAGGLAPLQLEPAPSVAAPTTGTHAAGEIFVDADADVYVCVVGGTPGTWRRLTAAAPDYDNEGGLVAGSINYLSSPIRIFDTRNNKGGAGTTPIANGGAKDVTVRGVTAGTVTIPNIAVAVVGNLTVTQTQNTSGQGGYLTTYAQGSPPPSGYETSAINWYAAGQTINNGITVALNLTNGKFTIKNGIVGGSSPTHVIFDAVAFVA